MIIKSQLKIGYEKIHSILFVLLYSQKMIYKSFMRWKIMLTIKQIFQYQVRR